MSRTKTRVSRGVFEVSPVAVNEERSTVEWSSLVWGKMEGRTVGQKPTIAVPPYERKAIARDKCPDANSQVRNLDAGRPCGAPVIFLRRA
ncbi:hypothetical protein DFH11DRAFT_1676546 [Phellopilus nigrolimitatus]|nr:hypothetical protein DFH11DRAFT_1676546 [Phellopilus nigrolimitatus]